MQLSSVSIQAHLSGVERAHQYLFLKKKEEKKIEGRVNILKML